MALFDIFDVAGSGLMAQSIRLNTTASNLANVQAVSGDPDTVYRSRHPVFATQQRSFADQLESARVQILGVVESDVPAIQRYQPGHPQADETGYVWASNVNAIEEMANMISASRAYQSNLEVINTSKELLQRTLSLGQG